LDLLRREREKVAGLIAVGGKIHTESAMTEEHLRFVQHISGLKSTSFHLIHAGHSLLLPPVPSSAELKMLILLLETFHALDPHKPELQITMAGRLSDRYAGVVGASILLSTDRGVVYDEESFATTHDVTGKRLMVFDAGVRLTGLPFDLPNAVGRTDMLGRRSVGDADRYQIIATLAEHAEYGGAFADLYAKYEMGFLEILDRYGFRDVLFESTWIAQHAKKGDSPEAHGSMVRKFCEAWMQSAEGDQSLIREVRMLIDRAGRAMRKQQPRLIRENPEELAKLMEY
jgi:hypothetical protein